MKLEPSSMNQYFIREPDGGMGGACPSTFHCVVT